MLSDEEKKAIEHLTKKMEYHKNKPLDTYVWLTLDEHYVRTILNLIEKQSKEIEELKEKYKIQKGLYETYGISKDKIKAKIEELEKLDFETDLVSQFTANLTTITILQSLLNEEE